MTWCGLKINEKCHVLVNQFHGNISSKTLSYRGINCVFEDVNDALMHRKGSKG